ncbi:MAG: YajQ family cyclic di-GMP-binding protein [Candidatus Omnitrophica bacterium]|nr:YajQ family cyclic di-GMP-binding protein [Candidatus Omnitrophota bacterium]
MSDAHSFDIVSKVNLQELRNALQQAQKEVATRFDFRGSRAGIAFEESPPVVKLTADQPAQLKGVLDVLQGKMAKRGVPLNAFRWDPPDTLPGGGAKQQGHLQQGLSTEHARDIVATIKALGLKVQPRIDGDAVRVSAKAIDDLQTVIQAVRAKGFPVPLQFENYR